MQEDNLDGFLGSSEEEKLRITNELLKLKMQAELGAQFHLESDMPAELENMFLKNILVFHKSAENRKTINIAEKLAYPKYESADNLNNHEIKAALVELEALMSTHHIEVDYLRDYNDRTKYIFLTEELFNEEIDDMEEIKRHFIYEEFHPDHEADIKK
jgi:hypothetical protein